MAFAGRRAPNVSQYLANLNVIPSEHDQQQEEGFNLDNDLDLFTNTDFINYEGSEGMNAASTGTAEYPGVGEKDAYGNNNGNGNASMRREGIDFSSGDYSFSPNTFGPHHLPPQTNFPHDLTSPTYTAAAPPLDPITYASPQSHSSPSASFPPSQPPGSAADTEDLSRVAAEEDKRRRNTAASARFRVKKKQREQALEKTAKELTDKVEALEAKVSSLRQENGWLRSLVVEKKGEEDLAEKFKAFRQGSEGVEDGQGERSSGGKKKGVGTKA